MKTIYFKNLKKFKENFSILENKLNVKLTIKEKQVIIEGEPVNEYEAFQVLDALNFGFSLKDALTLTNENFVFRKLSIKDFTRRKDMEDVRSRVIGTEGKTKRTIENISGCAIVVNGNTIGIMGPAESIEEATTGLANLIRGSKQSNVYHFLEKMNATKKEKIDLGLKNKKEGEKSL